MPLTLDCLCPDNDDAAACTLTELWWEGTATYTSKNGIEAAASVQLHHGAGMLEFFDSSGSFSRSINTSYAATWDQFFVRIVIDNSAAQLAVPGGAAIYEASWWMRAEYVCGTRPFTVLLYTRLGEENYCWIVVDVTARSYARNGNSGGYAILYDSGPLAPCNGTFADSEEFDALPTTAIDYVDSPSGSVCLCASGGVEPYFYYSVVPLPPGMVLDTNTGCITGKTSYKGANQILEFQVSDANRDIANVSCEFMFMCGGIQQPMNRMH